MKLTLSFSKPVYNQGYNAHGVFVSFCMYKCKIVDKFNNYTLKEFTVKGMAYCNTEDKVDEHKGKILADSKAKLEAYKIASTYFNTKKIEQRVKEINAAISFTEKMKYLRTSEDRHRDYVIHNV